MQRYKKGQLVSEQVYSEEAQASEVVKQKLEEWEKTKLYQMKQLETEMQQRKNHLETEFLQRRKEVECEIKEKWEKLKEEYNAFEQLKHQFEMEKNTMTKFKNVQQGQVKLNVGGRYFETSVYTLTKYQSTFQSMFSGRYEILKDSNGAIFIDGDGELFGVILNFLRRGVLPGVVDKRTLLAEAEYYGLSVLVSALKE